jgi:ectoine hydroxylase-related dioxygenase (phytanoyl-CoA dioxygenase family)
MATAADPTMKLTEEQIAQYHRDGYMTLDQVTPPEDVAQIKTILDDLFAHHSELPKEAAYELGSEKGGPAVIPQVIAPEKLKPELLETQYYQNAYAIAKQLLGPECHFLGGHAIYKPPHNQKETPWHQDQAYWNPGITAFTVNFWMPLMDAPVEAGCMWFIPRTHLGDLRAHHKAGNNPNMHTLETDDVDPDKAVACPLKAGGATLHALKTLHYTGPNNSDNPRPAYILTFGYEWQPGE